MSKGKVVDYFAELRKALPQRHFTQKEADAFGEWFKRLAVAAEAPGWTPEYVASLDMAQARIDIRTANYCTRVGCFANVHPDARYRMVATF